MKQAAKASGKPAQLKILVIRRDNIGDLVCTTPIFRALKERHPTAEICALVNSYNVAVLENNPDVDAVYAYTKAKHRAAGESLVGIYWERLKLFAALRRKRFDFAILAGPHFLPKALRLARWAKPKHIVGFTEAGEPAARHIDIGIPYVQPRPMHEAEDIFRLLQPLGIEGPPPPMRVVPSGDETDKAQRALAAVRTPGTSLIAVHVSARKPSQRWPTQHFIALVRSLHERYRCAFCLFWSPGEASTPQHPGDDAKARDILEALRDVPIVGYPTGRLSALIAGLAQADMMICSDGGAMHLGAALGKPILCFFGQSDSTRWYPWGVPHELLQPETREVSDIRVEEAVDALARLRERVRHAGADACDPRGDA
ncbi:MAG: glycosyltransferase family 9 protein [Betaproteobacteria bacterium]|nr:glycosyltransferase family 9 protein [Betaproteobacteria bacterium]